MLVLIMGHRRGISKALEELDIPYLIWSEKDLFNVSRAQKLIQKPFPVTRDRLLLEVSTEVTHVIAGTEASVIPASRARIWLGAKSNPHSLILRCTDKFLMKEYLHERGIPMTKFAKATKGSSSTKFFKEFGENLIIKPRKSSGSRGVMKISTKEEFSEFVNQKMIIEKPIEGKEGSVESLIENGEVIFTNITSYKSIGHCNLIPGNQSENVKKEILELNQQVIKELRISWGLTHLEYYETEEGILFGEIALRPPGGHIMDGISKAYKTNSWMLFVKVKLGISIEKVPSLEKYVSTIILHPNAGTVTAIEGLPEVEKIASLDKLKLKIKVGDIISERLGTGEDVGYAMLSNKSSRELIQDVDQFLEKLQIKLS